MEYYVLPSVMTMLVSTSNFNQHLWISFWRHPK